MVWKEIRVQQVYLVYMCIKACLAHVVYMCKYVHVHVHVSCVFNGCDEYTNKFQAVLLVGCILTQIMVVKII